MKNCTCAWNACKRYRTDLLISSNQKSVIWSKSICISRDHVASSTCNITFRWSPNRFGFGYKVWTILYNTVEHMAPLFSSSCKVSEMFFAFGAFFVKEIKHNSEWTFLSSVIRCLSSSARREKNCDVPFVATLTSMSNQYKSSHRLKLNQISILKFLAKKQNSNKNNIKFVCMFCAVVK